MNRYWRLICSMAMIAASIPSTTLAEESYLLRILIGGIAGVYDAGTEAYVVLGDHSVGCQEITEPHEAFVTIERDHLSDGGASLETLTSCAFGGEIDRPGIRLKAHEITLTMTTADRLSFARADTQPPEPCHPSEPGCGSLGPLFEQVASLDWVPRVTRLAEIANGGTVRIDPRFVSADCEGCGGQCVLAGRLRLGNGKISSHSLWKDGADFRVVPFVDSSGHELLQTATTQYLQVTIRVEGPVTFYLKPLPGTAALERQFTVEAEPGTVATVFLENSPVACESEEPHHFRLHYRLTGSPVTNQPAPNHSGMLNPQCSPTEYGQP